MDVKTIRYVLILLVIICLIGFLVLGIRQVGAIKERADQLSEHTSTQQAGGKVSIDIINPLEDLSETEEETNT